MNDIDLSGRVAVITGGARGIGFATAQRFLRSGARVALWDIDADRLKSGAQELAALGTVSAHVVELTDEPGIGAALSATLAAHSRLDIVVNSAGITGGNGLTWELDPKLRAGMTLSDEPGIYIPGEFGIRLEDDLLVTQDGAELLTSQCPSLENPFANVG